MNFYSLEDKSKFNWLLSNTDDVLITELSNFFTYKLFAIHALH